MQTPSSIPSISPLSPLPPLQGGGAYPISWFAELLFSSVLAFSLSKGGTVLDDVIKLLELVVGELGIRLM